VIDSAGRVGNLLMHLEGAILTGANLREADLLGADLTGSRDSDEDRKRASQVPHVPLG
jgi:uncharacterized protein YjbI with pentapeptide repeats